MANHDFGIAQAAEELLNSYRGDLSGVSVTASDGYITLAGVVPDLHLRAAAERAVRHLPGVRGVWNALNVVRAPEVCVHEITAAGVN